MTDDSALLRQRDAADYSALCMHVLNLDAVLTAAVLNDDNNSGADRRELAEAGRTLGREFGQIVDNIDRIEAVAESVDAALLRRAGPLTVQVQSPQIYFPSWAEMAPVNSASNIIRMGGRAELAKLEDVVAWLSGSEKLPRADLSRQVRGALMVIAAFLFTIVGHASGDPSAQAEMYIIAGPLYGVGWPMLMDDPDK